MLVINSEVNKKCLIGEDTFQEKLRSACQVDILPSMGVPNGEDLQGGEEDDDLVSL